MSRIPTSFLARLACLPVLCALGCSIAPPQAGQEPPKAGTRFTQGSTHAGFAIEHLDSLDADRDIQLVALNADYGYYLLDQLAIIGRLGLVNADGTRLVKTTPPALVNADTNGAQIHARFHLDLLTFGESSVFVDGGGGFLVTTDDFPPGGTSYNFTPGGGAGVAIQLDDGLLLTGGVRYVHISNAKGLTPNNPAFDSLGPFLGLIWTF